MVGRGDEVINNEENYFMGYIHKISGKIKHLNYEFDISLNGENLILVGANGIGKTSLLNVINDSLKILLSRDNKQYIWTKNYLNDIQNQISKLPKGSNERIKLESDVKYYIERLQEQTLPINVEIPEIDEFIRRFNLKKSIRCNFSAYRTSEINPATSSMSLEEEKQQFINYDNVGLALEQHLLNIKVTSSLLLTENNDIERSNKFSKWLKDFEKNLKYLFEDDSAELKFNTNSRKFYIKQGNKSFTFQELSSGYQAIFDVYADLLMRTELFDITPDELTGVVLIDEIDAHLHISLQKIILPFFINSFPKVQFIVSTHSPFVISSTSDIVIYDLTNKKLITGNLTYYSNNAIIKELFHVNTIHSVELKPVIDELKNIVDSDSIDLIKLNEYIEKLRPFEKQLDTSAKLILLLAKNKALDMVEEN